MALKRAVMRMPRYTAEPVELVVGQAVQPHRPVERERARDEGRH